MLITETWFNETSITNLDNYHLYDKRRNQCRGGGVAVYIRNDIVSNEITDKTLTSNKIEQIWCNIKTNRDSILIGCIYRPPTSDNEYNKSLDKILSRAKSLRDKNRYSGTLIVGDFNYPDIQWSNIGGYYNESIKNSSLNFLDNICSNHFSQHVIEPTLGTNFLDLVLTDDPSRIFAVNVGPPLGQSNKMKLHSSLTGDFLLKCPVNSSENGEYKPDFNKGNYLDFDYDLAKSLYKFNPYDTNASYNHLIDSYHLAMKKWVPFRRHSTTKKNKQHKWFNSEIKRATVLKYKLHCKCRASPRNLEIKVRYKIACKTVKLLVKSAVIKFESDLISKCKDNPKLLYSYINNQKSCKEHIRSLEKKDGNLTSDKNEIIEILNSQYCEVFNPIVNIIDVILIQRTVTHPCVFDKNTFSVSNIKSKIDELDIHKPAGPDGIHPRIIKSCPQSFAVCFSFIFNSSLATGLVPDAWKRAHITPIFKKGPRTNPSNYRPISLTALPCKIMDRLLRDVMMDHLTKNDLISNEQHGFVMNRSCLTNLLETIDIMTNA